MPLPPVDPSAAWGEYEVAATVGGRRVRVPPHRAADWLLAAWHGGGIKYLLELADPEDVDWMAGALLDDELDMDAAVRAAHEVLEAASGWRWWIAENLMLGTGATWPQIGGEMLLRGVRPADVGLGEWLAGVYAMLTRGRDEKDVNAFDQKLVAPPPGATEEAQDALEEMAAAMFTEMVTGGKAAAPFPG